MKKNSFWGWSFACAVALSWHAPVFAASPEMRLTEVQPATFKNPVVWADVPDPDVIRVGDYFYMVSTTMHLMPGAPVMRSKDLVNWETVSYLFDKLHETPKYDMEEGTVYGRGQWATSIRYHDGKFYALFSPNDVPYRSFIYTTDDPAKGWTLHSRMKHFHDCSLFFDDDGRAYQFYSSENNETMYISLLTDDYLKPSGRFTRNFIKESREAPAVFKHKGKYYMLSSGCTGWDPNVAEIAVADSIMGTWKTIGNPCTGPDADKTFYAQSTYVQPVIGKKNAYIAMFDRWKKKDLEDSRYVWLPVLVKDGKITIPWHEKWNLSIFDK